MAAGLLRRRHRGRRSSVATALAFLILTTTVQLGCGARLGMGNTGGSWAMESRRRLVGPGSAPPSCKSKCGSCQPCIPVHVPIHPGVTAVPLEYYPEAWRCQCGGKLYMP